MTKIEELKAAFEASTPRKWEVLMTIGLPHVVCLTASEVDVMTIAACGDMPDAKFIALAHSMMPELLEAVGLLKAAREGYMRYACDGHLDMAGFVDEMQGTLAGDVCSETLEKLEVLK